MPKIFISYRRDDSQDITGRIYDKLEQQFGTESVFIDIENIPPGVDFRDYLGHAVAGCDILLAIIGNKWLEVSPNPKGNYPRRLDDPSDYVRIEVVSALSRDIPVIPVLVADANMPSAADLPDDLKPLAYRNATVIRSGKNFREYVQTLIDGIREHSDGKPDRPYRSRFVPEHSLSQPPEGRTASSNLPSTSISSKPITSARPVAVSGDLPRGIKPRKYETVGIDLGTTFSSIAYVDMDGQTQIVRDPDNDRSIIPSAVLFDGKTVRVGEFAVDHAEEHVEHVIQFAKRSMGEKAVLYRLGETRFTPELISSLILRKLIRNAEREIGPITRAVITVPAFFNETRRAATELAGQLAGIEVVATLNEPTAAVLAYDLNKDSRPQVSTESMKGTEKRRYVVYDLGGGTFDVTVIEISGESIQELATGGSRELGGLDWDNALLDYVADEFKGMHHVDPLADSVSHQRLYESCRKAKLRLSDVEDTIITHSYLNITFSTTVTREQFEKLTTQLLGSTAMTLEVVLRDAQLTWSDIYDVVVVGGSTRMPMVQQMLRRVSGKQLQCEIDPDLAVALGAANYAAVLEETARHEQTAIEPPGQTELIPDSDSTDDCLVAINLVNSHGVGVFAHNQNGEKVNVVMVPKNSRLPTSQVRMFRLRRDAMSELRVTVSEGDSSDVELSSVLGVCSLGPLQHNLPRGTIVELELGFTEGGRVSVTARCEGQVVRAEISGESLLTEAEFNQAAEDLNDLDLELI